LRGRGPRALSATGCPAFRAATEVPAAGCRAARAAALWRMVRWVVHRD
jgi:hypothetical protein